MNIPLLADNAMPNAERAVEKLPRAHSVVNITTTDDGFAAALVSGV